eukprot:TRINITY_DN136_c1_g1_i2.p1 TRINITY_DN136_c1_g1~~TRINITY_DN136_c1_g1_i2.p1  ORF type:complete len:200 (+),score=84.11 TRINITY_DN136_c1_g1_i2:81-680(+)
MFKQNHFYLFLFLILFTSQFSIGLLNVIDVEGTYKVYGGPDCTSADLLDTVVIRQEGSEFTVTFPAKDTIKGNLNKDGDWIGKYYAVKGKNLNCQGFFGGKKGFFTMLSNCGENPGCTLSITQTSVDVEEIIKLKSPKLPKIVVSNPTQYAKADLTDDNDIDTSGLFESSTTSIICHQKKSIISTFITIIISMLIISLF